mmetsp:Transcript_36727/g.88801  ORF Transcript_36727/g.88801 Transcript_36727/m.88801 type:complete len:95 (+) Transcript_36727:152-436(+)
MKIYYQLSKDGTADRRLGSNFPCSTLFHVVESRHVGFFRESCHNACFYDQSTKVECSSGHRSLPSHYVRKNWHLGNNNNNNKKRVLARCLLNAM